MYDSHVRFTDYFARNVLPRRPYLRQEWLERAIDSPAWTEVQDDGRARHWVYIGELMRYLRQVTLADGETNHNAFLDRRARRPDR